MMNPAEEQVRENNMQKSPIIIFILLLLSSSTLSLASTTQDSRPSQQTVQSIEEPPKRSLEIYHLIQEIVKANLPKDDRSTEILELKIKNQEEKIRKLEKELIDLKKPDDNSIPSLVLSSVSVIITVLGVLIAVLSIFGYSNIKREAIKNSKDTAKETVELIANDQLVEATENGIIKLIEKGRFDEIIQNAVANIEYRGISIPDGIPDEERSL